MLLRIESYVIQKLDLYHVIYLYGLLRTMKLTRDGENGDCTYKGQTRGFDIFKGRTSCRVGRCY